MIIIMFSARSIFPVSSNQIPELIVEKNVKLNLYHVATFWLSQQEFFQSFHLY